MDLVSHNNILGWLYGFQITNNNVISAKVRFTSAPYKPIIIDPSASQCWKNWNIADTGMVFATVITTLAIGYPIALKSSASLLERQASYKRLVGLSWVVGFIFGLRNSCYRLQGLVPNGLTENVNINDETVKYDYTSDFLEKTVWGYIFASQKDK